MKAINSKIKKLSTYHNVCVEWILELLEIACMIFKRKK